MKKRLLSYILTVLIVTTLIPGFSVASAATNINIGDYIEMGEYYGEPILWRCVDIDENGPLILSDKIICLKPFDAAGDNTSGSHGRVGEQRKSNGSNYWADSNIRSWLNSDESAGNVTWLCGNPPDEEHVICNAYADEAGFITNFNEKELKAIVGVYQDSLLNYNEYSDMSPYGQDVHSFSHYIYSVVQNAKTTAYREQVDDRFFLLDVNQVYAVYNNRDILGDNYYIGQPTTTAVDNSEYKYYVNAGQPCSYWLRSPDASLSYGGYGYDGRIVSSDKGYILCTGEIRHGGYGIRPAFYLHKPKAIFIAGDGTESNPYRMVDRGTNYGNKLLNAMNATPATEYNNELARIAATICRKTYDDGLTDDTSLKNCLEFDYGFDRSNMRSYSVDANDNVISGYGGEHSMAFTIATKEAEHEGEDDLMVIVCQGSTNFYELSKDATALPSKIFKGYYTYDIVWDFYNNVYRKLSRFLDDKHYKVLITGHSLGGAAGSLVAAEMIMTGSKMFDVYCYTFGSVNSIASVVPVQYGYERIHNVYNLFDTFSPYQFGLRLPTGMGTGYGKFGKMEMYAKDYRAPIQIGLPALVQIAQHVNHDLDNYIDAIDNNYILNSKYRNNAYNISACPVDIDVYCEGELVGRVVNNEVDESVTSIDISVNDGVKSIIYPDDKHYDLKITAFDEGEMVYSTYDPTDGDVKMMTSVALSEGKTMTSEVSGEIDASETQLLVVDENNEIISKVQADGTEAEVNKDEIVFGNTGLINTGEKILLSSVIENFTAKESEPMDIIAALYYDGIMIDFGMYRDITIPVNREVRRNFELKCQGEYQDDVSKLKVKLFYWNLSQMLPIRGVSEFLIEQPIADALEQVDE